MKGGKDRKTADALEWLDETDFKSGAALCQSIPGATGMQTAAYVGLRVSGISGAFAAYLGFGLPSFILILILSFFYARFSDLPIFISLFSGLQVILVAIILYSVYSFGRNIANNYRSLIIALLSAFVFWDGIAGMAISRAKAAVDSDGHILYSACRRCNFCVHNVTINRMVTLQ